MNTWGREGLPFLFIWDYDLKAPMAFPLNELPGKGIFFRTPHQSLLPSFSGAPQQLTHFEKAPMPFDAYHKAFEYVHRHILRGNSYLLNLTFPTPIYTQLGLGDIFRLSHAPYKLWVAHQMVVFSPESFVTIRGNQIASFPMKGTIDASVPMAEVRIMEDRKEKAEHTIIVDLIRNDLSMVARKVGVRRFRYLDRIHTQGKTLLQVSSEINGTLPGDWRSRIGDLLYTLLPAGSISGAPKPKTLELIREAEQYDRGYYTGIFGVFDGENLDSAVMIRFIEQQGSQLVYKSGGGITALSEVEKEYQELIDKVYLPLEMPVSAAQP